MKKINLFAAVIIISNILLLSGCKTTQTNTAAPELLAEFEIVGGIRHIILPVTFQNVDYPFVLDTAGMATVFDDSFKDKLGPRFLWPTRGRGPEGVTFQVEHYQEDEHYLGPLKLADSGLLRVIDLDKLVPGENRDFQGIIGLDFLKNYVVQIDFDEGWVRFFEGKKDFDLFGIFKPKENKHPEWGEPIPMKSQFLTGLRYVQGNLAHNGKVNFIVDTGWFSPNALNTKIFDKLYPKDVSGNNSETKSQTAGPDYSKINIIESYSVGPFEYKNDVFRRSNASVLGLTYLSRHIVTFDFPNNVMYLQKGKNFDKQPKVVIRLIAGCLIDSESYIVSHVDPNGPAYKKGVREKDVLIKVDEREISSMKAAEFWEFATQVSAKENGEVPFTFRRDDEIFTVLFKKNNTQK